MTAASSADIWPTQAWERRAAPDLLLQELEACAKGLFDLPENAGQSLGLFVTQGGRCVFEHYAEGIDANTVLPSWSMAKSILHALVGILVARGDLAVNDPAPVKEWRQSADPRSAITLDDLLTMRSGLEFVEDYIDDQVSDVIEMLWGSAAADVAAFAANKPLLHEPGSFWSYSSGTSNIVSRILSDLVGRGEEMQQFMFEQLFKPLGMASATPKFDQIGTFKGSSFCFCNIEDFARFGYLYLRDGIWEGHRILPQGWVDYARTPVHLDAESGYGSHWWITPDQQGFYASGYEGQHILVVPSKDLVVVKLGKSPAEVGPELFGKVRAIAELF